MVRQSKFIKFIHFVCLKGIFVCFAVQLPMKKKKLFTKKEKKKEEKKPKFGRGKTKPKSIERPARFFSLSLSFFFFFFSLAIMLAPWIERRAKYQQQREDPPAILCPGLSF